MKKALVGLCNNVSQNLQKIKVWSTSFRKFSDGDIVLLCANSTESDRSIVTDMGIAAIPCSIENTWYINHKRLECTYKFLDTFDADICIVTDVFDVIFQGDPFQQLEIDNFDIFVSGEGVTVGQEPWNADNITKIFPEHREACQNQEVINSGVIAGRRTSLIKLLREMYNRCENGTDRHNIKDQSALIVMIARGLVSKMKMFTLDDGWAMHCAVAGPTQFFQQWGFDKSIKYGIPYMKDGIVYTKNGKVFPIVHQHNRIPEWKQLLEKPYV